jgi:hypothetical protein
MICGPFLTAPQPCVRPHCFKGRGAAGRFGRTAISPWSTVKSPLSSLTHRGISHRGHHLWSLDGRSRQDCHICSILTRSSRSPHGRCSSSTSRSNGIAYSGPADMLTGAGFAGGMESSHLAKIDRKINGDALSYIHAYPKILLTSAHDLVRHPPSRKCDAR